MFKHLRPSVARGPTSNLVITRWLKLKVADHPITTATTVHKHARTTHACVLLNFHISSLINFPFFFFASFLFYFFFWFKVCYRLLRHNKTAVTQRYLLFCFLRLCFDVSLVVVVKMFSPVGHLERFYFILFTAKSPHGLNENDKRKGRIERTKKENENIPRITKKKRKKRKYLQRKRNKRQNSETIKKIGLIACACVTLYNISK